MDKRRGKRFPVGTIESFNFHTTNQEVEMSFPEEISLRDISLGGLGIKSNVRLQKETTLSINLQLEEESYVVIGKVVWCKSTGDQYDCGLKLIYMPEPLIAYFSDLKDSNNKYPN